MYNAPASLLALLFLLLHALNVEDHPPEHALLVDAPAQNGIAGGATRGQSSQSKDRSWDIDLGRSTHQALEGKLWKSFGNALEMLLNLKKSKEIRSLSQA